MVWKLILQHWSLTHEFLDLIMIELVSQHSWSSTEIEINHEEVWHSLVPCRTVGLGNESSFGSGTISEKLQRMLPIILKSIGNSRVPKYCSRDHFQTFVIFKLLFSCLAFSLKIRKQSGVVKIPSSSWSSEKKKRICPSSAKQNWIYVHLSDVPYSQKFLIFLPQNPLVKHQLTSHRALHVPFRRISSF